jgi:DNA-binding transcriptional regulator YiaG
MTAEIIAMPRRRRRINYAALAGARIAGARRAFAETPAEFATRLTAAVGWQVEPYAVQRWEDGSTPPGDLVMCVLSLVAEVPTRLPEVVR